MLQRVEATLLALDAINAGGALLGDKSARGLVLGAELRDSCWAPPTALRQTIELVRDAIALPPRSPTARHPLAACATVSFIWRINGYSYSIFHSLIHFRPFPLGIYVVICLSRIKNHLCKIIKCLIVTTKTQGAVFL